MMRKLIFGGLVLLGVLAGGIFGQELRNQPRHSVSPQAYVRQTDAPQQPEVLSPRVLVIPKINVMAAVEEVGLDDEGKMDVPQDVFGVGWYNLGFKPGERGNAVIAGHLDSTTGPAVFYDLDLLETGDKLIVTNSAGRDLTFVVTGKASFAFDQFPLEEVFGANDKNRLNLITCGGIFDRSTKNYSQRLVVYSELIQS